MESARPSQVLSLPEACEMLIIGAAPLFESRFNTQIPNPILDSITCTHPTSERRRAVFLNAGYHLLEA